MYQSPVLFIYRTRRPPSRLPLMPTQPDVRAPAATAPSTPIAVAARHPVLDVALSPPARGDVATPVEPGAGLGDDHPLVRRLARPAEGDRLLATYLGTFPATTASLYRQRLTVFAAHAGVAPGALAALLIARGPAATTLAVRDFAAALRQKVIVTKKGGARTLAAATRNGYLDAVRSFIRFLNETHLIPWRVHVELDPVTAYRDTAGPGVEAVGRVLAATSQARDPRVAARDLALVSLYADWGLRASEPLGLDLGDVERDATGAPVAIWVRGKGRSDRERFSLPPATAEALGAWLAVRVELSDFAADAGAVMRGDPRPLFVALDPAVGRRRATIAVQPLVSRLTRGATNALIARLGRRAGLRRLTPHMLRHTAITAVLDAGASIREAQRFSRHKDPRVLLRYDDNREDLGGRRAAELSAQYRGASRT
jgi:integrase/recombinase XerC